VRLAVATLGLALLLLGPLVPASWLYVQHLNAGVCGHTQLAAVSIDWLPPRVTCTYERHHRLISVGHDAPYRDVAGALMAMGLVLAIAAFGAPPRRERTEPWAPTPS
jgi:hypothetical protein